MENCNLFTDRPSASAVRATGRDHFRNNFQASLAKRMPMSSFSRIFHSGRRLECVLMGRKLCKVNQLNAT